MNCRGRLDVLYSLYMYNDYEIEYYNNITEYLGKLFPWFQRLSILQLFDSIK